MNKSLRYNIDDYYELYAWDVVDIFFATVVASLPALNGVLELAISKTKSWGSVSAMQLRSKIRSFGNGSPGSQTYNTKLSDEESKEGISLHAIHDRSTNRSYLESEPLPGR